MSKLLNILGTFYNALKTKFATKDQIKQADWNQSDPKQLDYVKNRPFYTQVVEKSILSKRTINKEDYWMHIGQGNSSYTIMALESDIVSGNIYRIIFNDHICRCKAYTIQMFGEVTVLGNYSLFTGQAKHNTGEPFLFSSASDSYDVYIEGYMQSCTIEIADVTPEIKKLDYKYLPDEYQEDIDELWNNFGSYYTKTEIDAMIGDVENGSY